MANTFSRPWRSQAPDVIDDLVTFITTAIAGQADVQVKDGPWTAAETSNSMIVIGWSGFPAGVTRPAMQMQEVIGGADITSTGVHEGLGLSILETMVIACGSLTRDGTGNVSAARRLAYSNAAIVGKILADHQTAGVAQIGHVMQAVMGVQTALHQVQDRRGVLAIVTFAIEARAYAQQ